MRPPPPRYPVRSMSGPGVPVAGTRPAIGGDGPVGAAGPRPWGWWWGEHMPGRSARTRSIKDQNTAGPGDRTPVVGSSKMRRSGSWIKAPGDADKKLHAAGELAGGLVGGGPQSRGVEQGADAYWGPGTCSPKSLAKKSMFSKTLAPEVEVLAQTLGHVGDARAGGVTVGGLVHVAAEGHGRSRPESSSSRRSGP